MVFCHNNVIWLNIICGCNKYYYLYIIGNEQLKITIMKTQTGIITYKNYTEKVTIDNNFDTQALYDIMKNDPDFVSFKIEEA